jgi:predicted transcriptional regulator
MGIQKNYPSYTRRIEDNIKKIPIVSSKVAYQKLDNNFSENTIKQKTVIKGKFAKKNLVFPYEDILCQGLKIIQENPSIGELKEDTRPQHSEDNSIYTFITFKHTLPIFQPSKITMATISQYYKQKYNINIYILTENIIDLLCQFAKQLTEGQKLGVIIKICPVGQHVTPIILSKNNQKIYVVILDSIKEHNEQKNCFISDAYLKLAEEIGINNFQLLHTDIQRQKDNYSCINDAFIVLKDALVTPKVITSYFNSSKINYTYKFNTTNNKINCQVSVIECPKFLYKTMQNKQLLDELTTEDLQTNLKQADIISLETQQKTLQQHLNEYNCIIEVEKKIMKERCCFNTKIVKKKWLINSYLQVKAYRMLVKSFKLIDNSSGKIDQSKAELLVKTYVNPKYLLVN